MSTFLGTQEALPAPGERPGGRQAPYGL